MRLALLGVLSLLAFPSFAGLDERIQVAIEEPVQGERYSGISNLRGWAVSPEGTGNFYHQVFIDGDFAFYMSPYGNRADVGSAFPDYPDSDTAGFSMAFNYKDLAPGQHEIKVRAFDNASNYNEAVTTFTTERFDSTFIASDSDVDLSGLDNVFLYDDQALLLNGANVEGKRWNFLLKWDKPSQSFKIWGIEGYAGDLSYSTGYEIAGSDSSASAYAADCDPLVFGCSDSSGSSTADTGSGGGSSGSSTTSTGSGSGSSGSSTTSTGSGSGSSGSSTADTGSGGGSSGSSTTSTGSDTGFSGSGSSSSDDSGSDTADCDPAVDFGCQHGGTTGSDSSDSTGTTDDCANVTGYNPNCSDSSASGGSTSSSGSSSETSGYPGPGSSSGSSSETSGSAGSGSSSGSSSETSAEGCYSSDNRCVQVYPSSLDLGNSAFSSRFQVTIEERTVAVVGLSIEPSFYQEGRITFGFAGPGSWFYGDELVIWISETPDGASVSDSCRYKGFFEGGISFRLDGSGSCSLSTGEYFVNFAVCSSDPEDWACSFDGAVMNSQDLEMILQSRYL